MGLVKAYDELVNNPEFSNGLTIPASQSIQDSGTDAIRFDGSANVEIPNGNVVINGENEVQFDNSNLLSGSAGFYLDNGTDGIRHTSQYYVAIAKNGTDVIVASSDTAPVELRTGADTSGDLNFSTSDSIQDSGTDAISFDGSANVSIPNGSLDMHDSAIEGINYLRATQGTTNISDFSIYTSGESDATWRVKNGHNNNNTIIKALNFDDSVTIPNGSLTVSGGNLNVSGNNFQIDEGQSIQDDSNNNRVEISGNNTKINNENGEECFRATGGLGARVTAWTSNDIIDFYDNANSQTAFKYETGNPGTLELTNSNLDASSSDEIVLPQQGSDFTGGTVGAMWYRTDLD